MFSRLSFFSLKGTAVIAVSLTILGALIISACSPGLPQTGGEQVQATEPAQTTPVIPTPAATLEMTEESVTPSVTAAEQQISEDTVVVSQVVSSGPGWIVIHIDNNGSPGPVIGHEAVTDGVNNNVAVPIDVSQATPTLYAMLHIDAGQVGVYEFPGADTPAMVDGNMVSPAFTVTGLAQATEAPGTPASSSSGSGRDDYGYGSEGYPMETEESGEDHSMGSSTDSVEIENQQLQNGAVIVHEVYSSGPAWLVIHADNAGKPGPVIGVAAVQAGEVKELVVPIDAVKATTTLYAMLHTDAGQVGVYEFPGADTPVMIDGQMVSPAFNVSGSIPAENTPAVVINDQQIIDGQVHVPAVISNGPGWMVIHDDGGGKPGAVLGHTVLTDGLNTNVAIEIAQPTATTGKLYAMLHTDAGTVGTYEFPGADGPVMVGDTMVAPVFGLLARANQVPTSTGEPGGTSVVTANVNVVDRLFDPAQLTIAAGTTVVWTNNGNLSHTVTSDTGLFDSGSLSNGETFTFTFTTPGTYAYHCDFHGEAGGIGMSGVIIVQ